MERRAMTKVTMDRHVKTGRASETSAQVSLRRELDAREESYAHTVAEKACIPGVGNTARWAAGETRR